MDGILNINKPTGPTSHDIVARLRRSINPKRIGHAGTLDPPASGVLLICIDNATRITEYLMNLPKEYVATLVLGAETDTEDQTGRVVKESDCSHIDRLAVENVLERFVGSIMQVPPMVSAVHYKGRRLYEIARTGKTVERQARAVEIYHLELLDFHPGPRPEAVLHVKCSRGTYIRTLCADIGRALGCGGFMSSLVRTAVGKFSLDKSVTVETVEEMASSGRLSEIAYTIDEALEHLPFVTVSGSQISAVANGVAIPIGDVTISPGETEVVEGSPVRIHDPKGELLGIGIISRSPRGTLSMRPDKVFIPR